MFAKEVYVRRRQTLLAKMREAGEKGLILFVGNAEAPAQYKDNCYKWRQDSTWLYFMGLDEPLMAATLDIETGKEVLYADDVDIDDIIWMGPQPSVRSKADAVGVEKNLPYAELDKVIDIARRSGRPIHYINPSRYFNTLKLMELMGTKKVQEGVSKALTEAIISMRLIKEDVEIEVWTMPATWVTRCIRPPGTPLKSASWNRRLWVRWKLWRWPKAGAFRSPPSSPSTVKPCTTMVTPLSSSPVN